MARLYSSDRFGSAGGNHSSNSFKLALDIQGFTVIKMVLYGIDALVEKEVIPEVFNELICIEGRL
jgi:hypothetical protein